VSSVRAAFRFPTVAYPIVDAAQSGPRSAVELADILLGAGAKLLQLRAKQLSTRAFIDLARVLHEHACRRGALLVVNDRADIAKLAGAAGVHLGQTDLPPADARRLLGPEALIGFSTHDVDQVRSAVADGNMDYLAFGPIYPTTSKAEPDPCQGLDGLQRARAATTLPLVAIGGITPATARAVLAAGADAIAMIGALARASDPAAVIRSLA
jgi:thiamine-phosphate pyrophosphorylase